LIWIACVTTQLQGVVVGIVETEGVSHAARAKWIGGGMAIACEDITADGAFPSTSW